jgi:hypothetical protein
VFPTLTGLAIVVAFLLPGFIVADLAESRRATRPAGTDLELVLRALVFALAFQGVAAASGWTGALIDDLDGKHWRDHLDELAAYVGVVCIAAPTLVGLWLSNWLRSAEQGRQLRPWHYAFGARDRRKAWDFMFGRSDEGQLVLITTSEDGRPVHFLGKFGRNSYATQAPTDPPEIYLQEAWPANRDGIVTREALDRKPKRGLWLHGSKIERVELIHLDPSED